MSSSQKHVREEFVEPVRRTLRWLAGLERADGKWLCPEHKLEHTGKNCGAAVMAAVLSQVDPKADHDWLLSVARAQGRRMLANLVREGTSPCHTFRPGRHDPFNCSNSVIDGGAASDALAQIVRTFGPRLESAERERFAQASLLHARTYLRYAVVDKGIPAQRAWGLTGLAAAWSLERDPVLESAALEAIGQLEGVQNEDGSFPYHPAHWGALHTGSTDVSAFYQSRCTGFVIFALERLGRDPRNALFAGCLRRGLEFLSALIGPNGIKCGAVEAKPWYWGAEYEVASHPFDVYTLARGYAHFGQARWMHLALASFRAWAQHLAPDGRPSSHAPGPGRSKSYQCPVFWSGHAQWMARALVDLEQGALSVPSSAPGPGSALDLSIARFPVASLARLEDGAVVALVRGARPRGNVHHGSPRGAGLLQVTHKPSGRDLLGRDAGGDFLLGEWVARAGARSLARGLKANRSELRFALWLARNHWRGRRFASAAGAWPLVLRRGPLAYASNLVSSAYACQAALEDLGDGVRVRSGLAWRDGTLVPESLVERRFQLDGEGLQVEERLLAAGAATQLEYRLPAAAKVQEQAPGLVRYRLGT